MRFFPCYSWQGWAGDGNGWPGVELVGDRRDPPVWGRRVPLVGGRRDTAFGGRRDPAAHPAASPPVCRDATPGAGCPSPNSEKWAQAASRAQSHSGGCLHVCVGVAAQLLRYSAGSLTPILLSPAFFSRSGSAGLQQRGSEHRLCPACCSPEAGLVDEALLQTPEQC